MRITALLIQENIDAHCKLNFFNIREKYIISNCRKQY